MQERQLSFLNSLIILADNLLQLRLLSQGYLRSKVQSRELFK